MRWSTARPVSQAIVRVSTTLIVTDRIIRGSCVLDSAPHIHDGIRELALWPGNLALSAPWDTSRCSSPDTSAASTTRTSSSGAPASTRKGVSAA